MAQVESLALAVRLPVVVRYFGELMSGIAVMIAVIAGASFVLDDPALAARPGAAWAGVLLTGFAQRCRFNRIAPCCHGHDARAGDRLTRWSREVGARQ